MVNLMIQPELTITSCLTPITFAVPDAKNTFTVSSTLSWGNVIGDLFKKTLLPERPPLFSPVFVFEEYRRLTHDVLPHFHGLATPIIPDPYRQCARLWTTWRPVSTWTKGVPMCVRVCSCLILSCPPYRRRSSAVARCCQSTL